MNQFRFSVEEATIENYIYDLEILVVLSRDRSGNRFLRVHETLTADTKILVDVRKPDKTPIGDASVHFDLIKPTTGTDTY